MCDGQASKVPSLEYPDRLALRSDWRFGAFIHFSRLFADALQILSFPADQLEEALEYPASQTLFLSNLLSAFLGCKAGNWQSSLSAKLKRQYRDFFAETGNPLETSGFLEVEALQRLSILYALAEWRLTEAKAVRETILTATEELGSSVDALRAEALGSDSRNGSYWFFGTSVGEDCWLYRSQQEEASAATPRTPVPPAREAIGSWSVVSSSLKELQAFEAEVAAVSGEPERRLAAVLREYIIPGLVASVPARRRASEKAARKQVAFVSNSGARPAGTPCEVWQALQQPAGDGPAAQPADAQEKERLLPAEWESKLYVGHDTARDPRAARNSQRCQVESAHAMAVAPGSHLARLEGSDTESSASSGSDSDSDERSHSCQPRRAAAGTGKKASLLEGDRPSCKYAWRPQRGRLLSSKGSDHRPDRGERSYSLRQRNAALSYATHDDSDEEDSSDQRQQVVSIDATAGKRKHGDIQVRNQHVSNGSARSEETDVEALADVNEDTALTKHLIYP